jgi:formylglycine-generating enzyme required for sulfatase activity
MVIKSNIFMGNSFGINNVSKLFATPDVSHNLFWKNGTDYNNCKKGPGDISVDPLFVNLSQNDYRLKRSSPCIGAAHDATEIGAFPLKKRPRKVKPKKILPPELSLEVSLEESGKDGILNGGEQGALIVIISNSGIGAAYDVIITYHSTSMVIGEGRRKIREIPPQSKKEVKFPLTIPADVSDEETSIHLEAVDKAGFKAEPLIMDVAILSILGRLTIETDPEKALVYLDEILRGEAPLTLEKLLPKTYQIRITFKDHSDINETLTLEPRADEIRQFVLLKLKGDLFLETEPTQAKITLQGQVQGTTPLKVSYIDVGSYQIAAEKYETTMIYRYKGEITIKPGENKIKIDQFTSTSVPSGMVLIPEGEFEMGSDGESPDENPAHKVYLKNYYIDKHEVSWAEFMKFVQAKRRPQPFYATDSRFNKPNYPAVGITYEEAQAYAKWVNKRLPTEAEWEKAAKGSENWKFPWGNEFSLDKANCATNADRYKYTAPVDSFLSGASPFGVLHMAGNVWEWCSDYYNATYYYISPPRNPKGPKEEERHVLRGGSWYNSRFDARTTRRWSYWPDLPRNYIGLRLVFPPE